jgi:hypothetical protein
MAEMRHILVYLFNVEVHVGHQYIINIIIRLFIMIKFQYPMANITVRGNSIMGQLSHLWNLQIITFYYLFILCNIQIK